jgi:tartrate dehydratase alpha subunit/fumarate hydratase class I-like protein
VQAGENYLGCHIHVDTLVSRAISIPVGILINSRELRAAGFKIKEALPPSLEAAARVRTRGAGLRSLDGQWYGS